jgi:hypothetical protein
MPASRVTAGPSLQVILRGEDEIGTLVVVILSWLQFRGRRGWWWFIPHTLFSQRLPDSPRGKMCALGLREKTQDWRPGQFSAVPSGLVRAARSYPGLTSWATLSRPFGTGPCRDPTHSTHVLGYSQQLSAVPSGLVPCRDPTHSTHVLGYSQRPSAAPSGLTSEPSGSHADT